ncbi:glycoside hydrolase family protein [Secundilactobacillus kimchicus JCM 15530]|uniref:Glycoside hydrolase family protein n=1 Tax=Secundilactobacillus kimchicus JCM 15530 TaxID=1302272 RepID=A0A0R1HW17_9LACO|nr:GH25 family lysozyme [Secundilactobacillus kimchicus]KRK47650.1 glycoside hydrolase family protein [Secundilactobacillus kimchicus JCM 15530]
MFKSHLLKKLALGALVLTSALAIGTTANAAKTKIADISQYQGTVNWAKAATQLKFALIRVQHGNTGDSDFQIDTHRNINGNGATKYGVPFGNYDFTEFTSVNDAKKEARDFYARSHKNARFYVLDNEKRMTGVAGKEQTYVNAWLSTMRSLTNKPLVYYSYQNFVNVHKINFGQFDGSWIANYSAQPNVATDLWQYTSSGSLAGISGRVDLNKVLNSTTVNSWLKKTPASYYKDVNSGATVTATRSINRYSNANLTGKVGSMSYGKSYTASSVTKSGNYYRIHLSNGNYITANKAYVQVK